MALQYSQNEIVPMGGLCVCVCACVVRISGQQGIGWPSLSAKLVDAIEPPPGSITWQIALSVFLRVCVSDLVWL